MGLYQKYRPKSLDEIVGNQLTTQTLATDLAKSIEDRPHALLFQGPTGCGKTTLARIVASTLNCSALSFHEIDSADFRGIDSIREIRKQSAFKPVDSECQVFLMDEVHKLSNDAMNALLKALEDAPKHVYYILATTDPQKLLATIRGRCAQYTVSPLNDTEMFKLLRRIVSKENQTLEKEIYDQIIQDSQGHPRNALQILDQVLSSDAEDRLLIAKRSAEVQSQTIELCRALLQKADWKKIAPILKGLKDEDPESIRRAVFNYAGAVLLNGENDQAAIIMDEFVEPTYNAGWHMITWNCYKIAKS
jgi:DNA polymerase III subunit gamma/tau